MALPPRQQRILEIETARVRHTWAKAQIENAGATPALTEYLQESLYELADLRIAHARIDISRRVD